MGTESISEAGERERGKPRAGYDIVVNGEPHTVRDEPVTYEQVIKLAYPEPPFTDPLYTVTFRRGEKPREGTLVKGQSVIVREKGTAFSVTVTDRS